MFESLCLLTIIDCMQEYVAERISIKLEFCSHF